MLRPGIWLALVAASSAQTNYFPLHIGNQWVYRGGGEVRAMDIARTQTFGGREYALLRGAFGGDAWLRMDGQGTLYAYNPQTNREAVWVAFGTPEGGSFASEADPCSPRGVVISRSAKLEGPAGEFTDAFEVRYPPAQCADAGLEREVYGNWVGLLRRVQTTIAGPHTYELIYARIGGATVRSERELAFGLTLDQAVYAPGQPVTVRLWLRHSQPEPIELRFNSGQTYEIVVKNEKGEVVYRWSEGRSFTQALRQEQMTGGEKNWVEVIRPNLARGAYVIETWLTTSGPPRFSATAGLEIR